MSDLREDELIGQYVVFAMRDDGKADYDDAVEICATEATAYMAARHFGDRKRVVLARIIAAKSPLSPPNPQEQGSER